MAPRRAAQSWAYRRWQRGKTSSMRRLPQPCLALITDRSLCPEGTLVARVEEAVANGVNLVQIREKDLSAGELYKLVSELKEGIAGRAILIVNDRVDIVMAAGVDGVQLPENGLTTSSARRIMRVGMGIGRSVHSVQSAVNATNEGADFLVLGTIFSSRTHPEDTAVGPALIAQVKQQTRVPLLAVGGVTPQNVAQCMEAGADGVAVISSILGAKDVGVATRDMKDALAAAWAKRAAAALATLLGQQREDDHDNDQR
ncbi:MAG: thiamine phosphate synthase [Dehalococcoidia bacterium]|nr:thiamine phosphate synthase [Dehalococcoidia bacterium]